MYKFLPIKLLILSLLITGFTGVSTEVFGQQHTVEGVVASPDGEPLPGVNVVLRGTTTGTTTDSKGTYSLTLPSPTGFLIFSFVGFQTQEIQIAGRNEINVELAPQALTGDEVLVIGYGTQERADVTGSIGSVSEEALSGDRVATNAGELIRGQVAGVDVVSNSNRPGAETTIRVRGLRSVFADNDPLVVVDGIPTSNDLNDFNTADIKSIDILKDASATAIYGSRGSNGVILVTTKQGRAGQTQVSYKSQTGLSHTRQFADVMNGEEFAELKRQSRIGAGQPIPDEELFDPVELENLQNGTFTDWQDLVSRTGFTTDQTLQVSGGNEQTTVLASGNFLRQEGVTLENSFERYSLRLNMTHQNEEGNLEVGVQANGARSINEDNAGRTVWRSALRLNPLGQRFNEDGTLRFRPTSDGNIANAVLEAQSRDRKNERTRIFASSYLDYQFPFLEGLSYRFNVGADFEVNRIGTIVGQFTNSQGGGSIAADQNRSQRTNFTVENVFNHEIEFGQTHTHEVNTTFLYSFQEQDTDELSVDAIDLPFEQQRFFDLGAGTIQEFDSDLEEWQLQSVMGRINYTFDNKYSLTFTARTDGSSRFAEGNKWGVFPSFGGTWRITQEDFFNSDFFTQLKFRASWGRSGNTNIPPFQTQGLLESTAFNFGNETAFGNRPDIFANPTLQWEKTKQVNAGLDFGVWNDRVRGTFDFFRATTIDLLLPRQIPAFQGFTRIIDNVGETRNRGFEVGLNNIFVETDDLRISANFQFTAINNEFVDIFGGQEDDVGNEFFIGEAIEVVFELDKIGIWQQDEAQEAASFGAEPGDIKIRDVNGDGAIDANDRIIHGDPFPEWTMNISPNIQYKNWDLSAQVESRQNMIVRNEFRSNSFNKLQGRFNNINVDFFTPDNPSNSYSQPSINQEFPANFEANEPFDASFWRIRNVTLGYTFPVNDYFQTIGIRNLRVYFSGDNLAVFNTGNFRGFDVETGIDADNAPSMRTFVFGVNLDF